MSTKRNLDILSKLGQTTLVDVNKVVTALEQKWKVNVIKTPEDQPAAIDFLLVKNNTLKAIAEIKCRNHTLQQIQGWGNTWLITHEKILQGAQLSKMLSVPYLGILYIIPNNLIYYWKITNEAGDYLFEFEVKKTQTQMTINGGKIWRPNAYLPLEKAKILKNISK